MKHLSYLATTYKIMAVIAGLGGLVAFGIAASIMSQPETQAWVIPLAVGAGVMSIIIGGLFLILSGELARGEGRTMATVLSVLQIGNCPGILVAAYTIWVCWINEETKAVFEAGGLRAPPTTEAGLSSPTGAFGDKSSTGLGGSTRDESPDGPLGGPT